MIITEILRAGPVVPVIVLNRLDQAVPLAEALVAGGIRVLEITLRTPIALEALSAIRKAVPDAIAGVGTVTTTQDLQRAIDAGAQFGVSPGSSPELLSAILDSGLPFLPGTMTPSDVLRTRAAGFTAMKLFPAQQAGGVGMLKALGSVFPDVLFCPTGGIDVKSAPDFLALANVACVGGSWLAPASLVDAADWPAISRLAATASVLSAKS